MSTKSIFIKSANSGSEGTESPDFMVAKSKDRDTYIPPIDFSSASNFVRFGSAKEYYRESIERIYNDYPYDGSKKEKTEFQLSSSYLDRYIFDVKYPKSTGYLDFGYDAHVVVNRGYKEATTPASSKLSDLFKLKSVVNETDKRRKQSFVFNFDDGVTFEWMMKKNGFDTGSHPKETIFEASSSEGIVRLALSASADGLAPIQFYASSSAEIALNDIGASTLLTSSVATSAWKHYAFSIFRDGSDLKTSLYIDGALNNTKTHTNIDNFDLDTTLFIASGSYGLLSASVDDFRYWNKKQSSQKIYRTRNVSLDKDL
jgi:hypothetical protein